MWAPLAAFLEPLRKADRGDKYTLFVCLSLCSSLTFMGADGGVLSLMIGSTAFAKEFNMTAADTGNFSISIWPPTVAGALFLAPLCSKFLARRPFFIISSSTLLLGVLLMTIGTNVPMLYVGRVIAGLGTGMITVAYNSYSAEVTRPQIRGFAISFNQFSYNFGVFIMFWIGLGTEKITTGKDGGGNGWRAASAIQALWGLIVIAAAILAPESPRQLLYLSKNPTDMGDKRVIAAQEALCRLRCRTPDDPELAAEFWDLTRAEEYQRQHPKTRPPASVLLRKRGFYTRWWFAALSLASGQLSGISALLVYGIVVFNTLGFSANAQSYLLNGLGGTLQLLAGIFPMLYVDRLGRRTILLFGAGLAQVGLILLTALFNRWPEANNTGASIVCVIAVYLIYIAYSGGTGAAGSIVAIEIWDTSIRAFGFGLATVVQAAVIIAIQKGFPLAIAQIGPKMYGVFLAMNTCILLLIYFFWPETKGIDVESMNKLFGEIDVLAAVHQEEDQIKGGSSMDNKGVDERSDEEEGEAERKETVEHAEAV